MVNTAQTQKQKLKINEMIIVFIDHNCCQQSSKNIKALAVKKKKSKSITEKKKPTALPAILPAIKKDKEKEHYKHCRSAHHVKKSYYYLMLANQRSINWKLYYGKEYLLLKNLSNAKLMQSPQFLIIVLTVNNKSKDTIFYLDSAAEVHICYNRLLFSTYNKENSLPIYIVDHT